MISIEARKIALAQALFDLDNESILISIELLLLEAQQRGDNWTPSKEQLKGIDEAMKQVENGEAISEEEIRERYKKMAKVTVKFAPKAQDDLDEIEEYYEDFPNSKQMQQIFDRVDDLKQQPLRGRPIPEREDKNIRHILAGNYRVIYHVVAEYLLMILRVFHHKRNLNPDDDLDFDN